MAVVVLSSKDDIEAFIRDHKKCIIKYTAEWCAPCRRMAQYFEEASTIYDGKINFARVDLTNDEQDMSSHFKIDYLPTFKAHQANREIGHVYGANFQNLCDLIKKLSDTE